MYVLDTNIFSYIHKKTHQNLLQKFQSIPSSSIFLASIVLAELLYGAHNHPSRKIELIDYYNRLASNIQSINFDNNAAKVFGEYKSKFKKTGKNVADIDLMIASICIANDLVLVTNNTKHFDNIDNLRVENWVEN